eukprot:78663_1
MGNNIKSPSKSSKSSKSNSFIIQHCQSNSNTITDISSFDERRAVFISVPGLYNTWHKCPSVVLYSAVCFLPLKKKWIYHPTKYMNEIKQKDEIFVLLNQDSKNRRQFINLLKWKHSQGLVFWLLDEQLQHPNNKNDLVSPLWHTFSEKLASLYNPVTGKKYNRMKFDNKFWTEKYNKHGNYPSKYGAKSHSILMELYCLSVSMKYKCVQEIIYQSNPQSLNPITSYDCMNGTPSAFNNAVINGDDGWIICSDYEQ